MKARPDYQPDPESQCVFEQALHASAVLEQLRPIIGEDRVREMGGDDFIDGGDAQGRYGSASRSLEETIVTCLENIRRVRGDFAKRHSTARQHLNLNVSFKERTENKLGQDARSLSDQFNFCHVQINWGEHPYIRPETARYGTKKVIVDAPYRYAKQIEAELAWVESKVVGPYSDIEESPDGILTARCQYAKMDKHHDWFVHDGYLAWMPHDECIKVKALGDDREKSERAARSSARREVLAAFG